MKRTRAILASALALCLSTISMAQEIEYLGSAVFGGGFRAVKVIDDYAYCAAEGGFMIMDVSQPDNIASPGGTSLIYNTGYLVVADNYAYVTLWMADTLTFAIIDIDDPYQPAIVATMNDTGVGPMAMTGNYIFIADQYTGIKIIDVSDPYNPSIAGDYINNVEIRDICISDSYGYLACPYLGLDIIDISDPTHPVHVTNYESPVDNPIIFVSINGSYAYLGGLHFEIVDISNHGDPHYMGDFRSDFYVDNICVLGDYAYALRGTWLETHRLILVNVEDPQNPYLQQEFLSGEFTDLQISGDRAYISGYEMAFSILDISVPDSPVVLGNLESMCYLNKVVVSGNYAYTPFLANGGFGIIDISDRYLPGIIGLGDVLGNAADLDVEGNYLYVGALYFEIFDISIPESPAFVTSFETPLNVPFVEVEGNYAYLPGLRVVDISDPANPFLAGECPGIGGYGISIQEDLAYIASRAQGLHIVDVSDPTNPVLLGSYASPDYARDVHVQGNYAYLALEENGMEIVDVSDPHNPYHVGGYDTPDYAIGIFIQDDYAYVANKDTGLIILDISEPSNPTLVITYGTTSETNGCYVDGEYIFLADSYCVVILRFDAESRVIERIDRLPKEYSISPNYPNPFNPSTTISYSLPEEGDLTISIYNLLGQRVATLLNGFQQAGQHCLTWDASAFPSGVYFARLETGKRSETIKMVLLK